MRSTGLAWAAAALAAAALLGCAPRVEAGCSLSSNATQCSGHGLCADHDKDGVNHCFCVPGFIGPACAQKTCPTHCSEHGYCDAEKQECVCEDEWAGSDCSKSRCPNDCSGHGRCDALEGDKQLRVCYCVPEWKGDDCSHRVCPRGADGVECSGNGVCRDGKCACDAGFTGEACGQRKCVQDCGHGSCVCPADRPCSCKCESPWFGPQCSRRCPLDCSGHGTCSPWGWCNCETRWSGLACEKPHCPEQCNGHGHCNQTDLTCNCSPVYPGEACDKLKCPSLCHYTTKRGECLFDKCHCYPGYTGVSCEDVMPAVTEAVEGRPCGEDCYDTCRTSAECHITEEHVFHFANDAHGSVEMTVPPSEDGASAVDPTVDPVSGARRSSSATRACVLKCLRTCMSKCFRALHALPESERADVEQSMRRSLPLPGGHVISMANVTGDINDLGAVDPELGKAIRDQLATDMREAEA